MAAESTAQILNTLPRWSLSLVHLRFYGEAVVSLMSSGISTSRVTFDRLGIAVLGSMVAG